jgi:hypothetical protein
LAEAALEGLVNAGRGEWRETTASNHKVIRTLHLVTNARRGPTEIDDDSDGLPDTAPDEDTKIAEKQAENSPTSNNVGRRADHPGAKTENITPESQSSVKPGKPKKHRIKNNPHRGVPGLDPEGGVP